MIGGIDMVASDRCQVIAGAVERERQRCLRAELRRSATPSADARFTLSGSLAQLHRSMKIKQ